MKRLAAPSVITPWREKEDFRRKTLGTLIKNYFGNSYFGAVSTLVEEEKISVDELKELIDMVENKNKDK